MSAAKSSASTAIAVAELVLSHTRCAGRDVAATTAAERILPVSASAWPTSALTLPGTAAHAGHRAR